MGDDLLCPTELPLGRSLSKAAVPGLTSIAPWLLLLPPPRGSAVLLSCLNA